MYLVKCKNNSYKYSNFVLYAEMFLSVVKLLIIVL